MRTSPSGERALRAPGRIRVGVVAGVATLASVEVARRSTAFAGSSWVRRNHRGHDVNLVAGPITALTATIAGAGLLPARFRRPALLLGLVGGAVGRYDDVLGARRGLAADKGFRGHLSALRSGRVSTGALKVVGLVGASIAAAGPVSRGPVDRIVAAGIMAGTANLVNLLDLRPGRAAKATALASAATLGGPTSGLSAAVLATSLGVLPADLGEKVMLGDAGANALGALVGFRLVAGAGPAARAATLAVLVLLTAASEKVSFTRVIEATPGLRNLDNWGRLKLDAATAAGT